MYDYQIIEAHDMPTLVKEVNKKFKEGYLPCGGFFIKDNNYYQSIAHPYRYHSPNSTPFET